MYTELETCDPLELGSQEFASLVKVLGPELMSSEKVGGTLFYVLNNLLIFILCTLVFCPHVCLCEGVGFWSDRQL